MLSEVKGKENVDLASYILSLEWLKQNSLLLYSPSPKLSPYLELPASIKTAIVLLFISFRNL